MERPERSGREEVVETLCVDDLLPAPEQREETQDDARRRALHGALFGTMGVPGQEAPAQTPQEEPAGAPAAQTLPPEPPKKKLRFAFGAGRKGQPPAPRQDNPTVREARPLSGTPVLVHRGSGRRVTVTHSGLHIGRSSRRADFTVPTDTTYLGSDHAYLLSRGGEWFVVDNRSMNHTWLNGALLEPLKEYPLRPGDELRMADQYFDVAEA